MKHALGKFIGAKHFMRSVPMQEKGLKKQRQEPVAQKEDENYHL